MEAEEWKERTALKGANKCESWNGRVTMGERGEIKKARRTKVRTWKEG